MALARKEIYFCEEQYYSQAAQQGNGNGIFTNLIALTYDVKVTDATGQQITSSVTITNQFQPPDILVPGAFTPNEDGRNDVLRVHLTGMRSLGYFRGFNRWGHKVFAGGI